MKKNANILIAGAGPSGLSAAIFLSEAGFHPRIIDKKKEISPYSKALALNPNTMGILQQYGLAEMFLNKGYKMGAVSFRKGKKLLFRNEFSKVAHKFPFLAILPQKESEELLLEEVLKRGINVEFSTELISLEENGKGYLSKIKKNGNVEEFNADYVIGADGAHSVVRKQLGFHYEGVHEDNHWQLYDVELETDLPNQETHIVMHKEGGIIMIPIRDNIWRVAGKVEKPLEYLPEGTKVVQIKWETPFNVTHHVANGLIKQNAVIIGDAAHLHSPIGGRGMNLGIEDAYLAVRLIKEDRLNEYEQLRLNYLRNTVKRIKFVTKIMTGTSFFIKFARSTSPLGFPIFPFIKPALRKFALGLDKTDAVNMRF